jgi:hypothetical protein
MNIVVQFLDAVVIGIYLMAMGLLVMVVLVGHAYNAWFWLTGKRADCGKQATEKDKH